jgi:hypothetical protein
MSKEAPEKIPIDTAESEYGITHPHERMPNGELRFRLAAADGSAYIRTVSTHGSGWQRSHYHEGVRETYVVQAGWMALATWRDGHLAVERFAKDDAVTTRPNEPHNVYLPAGAVIHTVKHGITEGKDWHPAKELDQLTQNLHEQQILALSRPLEAVPTLDPRHGAYVDLYNNLDSLLWQVPGFFLAGAGIFFGFVASSFGTGSATLPRTAWGLLLLFVSALFLIGAYSMHRIFAHHSRMGAELRAMEHTGYFHSRANALSRRWPPPAPYVFIAFFSLLGTACLIVGTGFLLGIP